MFNQPNEGFHPFWDFQLPNDLSPYVNIFNMIIAIEETIGTGNEEHATLSLFP